MKLGVLSDTHNDAANTRRALDLLREHGAERLIHCGDLTTPEIVALFEGWQVDFVVGNMDQSYQPLQEAVRRLGTATFSDEIRTGIGGVQVAATHGHHESLLDEMIRSGLYAYVFHGHTHRRRDEQVGPTRVVNPGALGGMRYQPRSFVVLDLASGELEFVTLDEA